MKKRFVFSFCILMVLLLAIAGCTPKDTTPGPDDTEPEDVYISMGTSVAGGMWQLLASGMVSIVSREYPWINISPEATGGGDDNVRLLSGGYVDFALAASDAAYNVYRGEGPWEGSKFEDIRGIIGGNTIDFHCYTMANSGINNIADLKGKRVSIGAMGSLGNVITEVVLQEYGLVMGTDWQPEYLGHADGADALRDGHVDAVVIVSSNPPAVMEIATTHNIKILDVDKLDQVLEGRPYWVPATIPAGIYRGVGDVKTFAVPTLLVTRADVDEDIIYYITKAILENNADMREVHSAGADWILENATRGIEGSIPFHPGAERYLKEQGVF